MRPCPFCGQPTHLTQGTYTPRYLCGSCGLDLQKVMICAEADVPGHWEVLSVLTEVGSLSPEELVDKVDRIIQREIIAAKEGKILIQIFVWKDGYVALAPPVLLDVGE